MKKSNLALKILIIVLIIVVASLFYTCYIGTKGLNIKEYSIHSNLISDSFDGFKIVHFSDLHYGSTIREKELKHLVKRINDQVPDVIVFTGDLVENNVKLSDEEVKSVIDILSELNAKIEILTIKGNHDYDEDYYDKIISKLNWINLDNTYEILYNNSKTPIVFVGLDDLTNGKPDYKNAFSFLNEVDSKYYTIVLTHEPDSVLEFKNYDFDLVLSGHSHLGQVRLPFIGAIYTPKGSKMYYDAHYVEDNFDMYISGGIGTSIIKMRLFNRPSFNLYRLNTK